MNEWVKALIAAAAGGVLALLGAVAAGWFNFASCPPSPVG
jgi:zinc transporter ZupT